MEQTRSGPERAGFLILGQGETLQEGDVVVIQPCDDGNPAGHMAIYDGTTWYSDFRQRDMWGGPGYRSAHLLTKFTGKTDA